MVKTALKTVTSKGWNWSQVKEKYWSEVSDEFLPVALRWKEHGYSTVLDLGCGRGRHTLFLAELGFQVTAVDLSPEGIDQLSSSARKRNLENNITTLVCDMLELPFEKNTFDCVLGFHSLYHTDFAGLTTVVSTVTRVLKESGQLYITFNSKHNPSFRVDDNEVVDDYTIIRHYGLEEGIPHTFLDYEDIVELLAGYEITKIQQIRDYFDNITSIHFFVEAEKKING
jgi:SAM-dependent methyltransferase